jgi:channel protein (hemolysin III family)
MDGVLRKVMLLLVWTLCLAGVILKTLFFDAIPEGLGLAFYVAFGWLGVTYFVGLARRGGAQSVLWCFAGGVSYTSGAVLEFARVPVILPGVFGPHEVFHLAIVLGVVCHWVCISVLMRKVSQDNLARK